MYLADTKDKRGRVHISEDMRSTHMHIIGASNTGKSKLLEHMIREDIKDGKGLCLIDPHGNLYDKIVDWCALNGIDEYQNIHLFEPTAKGWAFGFNPIEYGTDNREEIDFSIDSVLRVFTQVWGGEDYQKTPLLQRCLRLALFAVHRNNATLIEARDMTSSSDMTGLRRLFTANLGDDVFDREWEDMNALPPRAFNELFSSTNNRLFAFISSQIIAHTIGQQEHVLDVAGIMERGEILLVDLSSRGKKFSRENSSVIGALLVNDFLLKARSRPEGCRPFYLYIDECYRYLTDDIQDILFEARKFGLHLILAHQNLSQLGLPDSEMYNAVMSGAQSKVVFGLRSIKDAECFAQEFEVDLQEAKDKFVTYQSVGTEIIELESESETEGVSITESWTDSESESESESERAVEYGYEPDSQSESSSTSGGSSYTSSETHSSSYTKGKHQALRAIIEETHMQGYTLEEQRYKIALYIRKQPQRNALFITPEAEKFAIVVPDLPDFPAFEEMDEEIESFKLRTFQRSQFANPTASVIREIEARRERLLPPDSPEEREDW